MAFTSRPSHRSRRKGTILVLSVFMLVFMLAVIALSVDLGYMLYARTEAQRCADAAALAGAWAMVDDARVTGDRVGLYDGVRQAAVEYAALNSVNGKAAGLDANDENGIDGDVVIGRFDDPSDRSESLSQTDYNTYNTVTVRVQCTQDRNNAVPLFFAQVLGITQGSVTAEASATFEDSSTVGFRPTDDRNSSLIPFAIDVEEWEDILEHGTSSSASSGDEWSYDPETGTVTNEPDGIPEMKIFPESGNGNSNGNGNGNGNSGGNGGGSGIVPGNFGTVNIGGNNNSTNELRRQIREGPSAADMESYGGELTLDGTTGKLQLAGDPGVSAGIKSALGEVIGDPRTILLYSEVTGNGANAEFTIVGFAGIRMVAFTLTGNDKYILVQPAVVVDPTAVTGDLDSSYFVGQPVRLVR